MNKKAQTKEVVGRLKTVYPNAKIELNYEGNFQLLVAVILSAQCTDVRVNMVTPKLFARFPDAYSMAEADLLELEKLIYSTGFYRAKARNIIAASKLIVNEFEGKVPDNVSDLLKLPGVARKTANVVTWSGFGKAEGIVVDTHVIRLAGLLGLITKKAAKSKNAVKIEKELMKNLPKSEWGGFSHLLILHGRRVCIARRPQCQSCLLSDICPSSETVVENS
jgi:endonuclease-3